MKLTCNVIRLRIIGIRPHGRQVNDKDRGEDESDQSDEEDGQKAFLADAEEDSGRDSESHIEKHIRPPRFICEQASLDSFSGADRYFMGYQSHKRLFDDFGFLTVFRIKLLSMDKKI